MKPDNDNLPLDAHEQLLDAQLRRAMPVTPPADLADRIFAATVHALRDENSGVIGRIDTTGRTSGGWTQWTGWRYAAAIGLVVFYAALWAKPHILPTKFTETELARADKLIVDPQTHLDTSIDNVAAQLDVISNRLASGFTTASANTTSNSSLAHDLYQLDTSSF